MLECQHPNRRKITTRYRGARSRILGFSEESPSIFSVRLLLGTAGKRYLAERGHLVWFSTGNQQRPCCPRSRKVWLVLLFLTTAVVLNLFCPEFRSLETVLVTATISRVGDFCCPGRRGDVMVGNGGEANSNQPLRSTYLQTWRCWGGPGDTIPLLPLTGAGAGARLQELGGEEGCKAFPVRGVIVPPETRLDLWWDPTRGAEWRGL